MEELAGAAEEDAEPAETPAVEEAHAEEPVVEEKVPQLFKFVTSDFELTVEPLEGAESKCEAWLQRVEGVIAFLQLEALVGEKVAETRALYAEVRDAETRRLEIANDCDLPIFSSGEAVLAEEERIAADIAEAERRLQEELKTAEKEAKKEARRAKKAAAEAKAEQKKKQAAVAQ